MCGCECVCVCVCEEGEWSALSFFTLLQKAYNIYLCSHMLNTYWTTYIATKWWLTVVITVLFSVYEVWRFIYSDISPHIQFFSVLRGTSISKAKAHTANVLIIVCSTIVLSPFLKGEMKERGEVVREERWELEKIDTNSQKLLNPLLHLWREIKANCGHTQDRQGHLQKH